MKFNQLTIRRKIIITVVSISFLILTIGYVLIFSDKLNELKNDLSQTAHTTAELLSEYVVVPLAFEDKIQAKKALQALERVNSVVNAKVYTPDTLVFSEYLKDSTTKALQIPFSHNASNFFQGYYYVFYPIIYNELNYGTFFLAVSTQKINEEIRDSIVQFTALLLLLLILSLILANIFQKAITKTILQLSTAMQNVTNKKDFSIRVKKTSNDAIGILYDGFNSMLSEIDKAQQEIQLSEEKFRNYIRKAPDGIFVTNRDGNIIDSNPSFSEMTGYPNDELQAKNLSEIINLQKIQIKSPDSHKISIKSEWFSGDIVYDRNKNEQRYWSVSLQKLSESKFLGFAKDITERKKAEYQLRHLRNYLSNIINSMPSVIIGLDSDLTISQWNKEAERKTSISVKDAVGKSFKDLNLQLNISTETIYKSIRSRKVKTISKQQRISNDRVFYENITIYPLIANGIEGAVIRIDDITENIHLEEMMIQSEKMLSVGGLAAGMAHEINNPLAGMIQNASVILNRLQEDLPANNKAAEEIGITVQAVKDYMEKRNVIKQLKLINESGQRAARIVQNMLSFARKSESKNIPVNINQLVDNTLELIESDYDLVKKYDFKYIKIKKIYEPDLPSIPCDSNKIQQVFLNILKNGAEAMVNSKMKLEQAEFKITTSIQKAYVRVEIADNGPGLDETLKKRIFEPFFTTKAVGQGTGLGLSVSYFIITENHNGKMSVESELNKGTRFIIDLPVD